MFGDMSSDVRRFGRDLFSKHFFFIKVKHCIDLQPWQNIFKNESITARHVSRFEFVDDFNQFSVLKIDLTDADLQFWTPQNRQDISLCQRCREHEL